MIPVPIDTFELDTTIATIYTSSFPVTLTHILISNTTAGALTFTVHVIPPSGSVLDSNKIFGATAIDANDTKPFADLEVVMKGPGYTVRAFASGAGVNFTGSLKFTG